MYQHYDDPWNQKKEYNSITRHIVCSYIKHYKHLNIYNIGTKEQIKISQLAFMISKFYKKNIVLKKTKILQGSTLNRCPDIKKISKLGFKKRYNLSLGLSKTINWHINK